MGRRSIARNLRPVAVPLAVLVFVAGCAGGKSDYLSPDGALHEYKQRTKQLSLPAGSTWPGLKVREGDSDISYAKGAPTSFAEVQWRCAWERSWIKSRADKPKLAAKSLKQLATYPTMHDYRVTSDDGGRKMFDEGLQAAKLGDPTLFQRDVDLNC